MVRNVPLMTRGAYDFHQKILNWDKVHFDLNAHAANEDMEQDREDSSNEPNTHTANEDSSYEPNAHAANEDMEQDREDSSNEPDEEPPSAESHLVEKDFERMEPGDDYQSDTSCTSVQFDPYEDRSSADESVDYGFQEDEYSDVAEEHEAPQEDNEHEASQEAISIYDSEEEDEIKCEHIEAPDPPVQDIVVSSSALQTSRQSPDSPVAVVTFLQVGGNIQHYPMYHGWNEIVEHEKAMPASMVAFLGARVIQLVPYQRLRMLSAMSPMDTCEWEDPLPPVVCIPICDEGYWVLVAVIIVKRGTTVFLFDGRTTNDKSIVAGAVKEYLSACGVTKIASHISKVPVQDCHDASGYHLISHLVDLVRVVNDTKDEYISSEVKKTKFATILPKKMIRSFFEDALSERLYNRAYWGKYCYQPKHFKWWPCQKISPEYAKLMCPNKNASRQVPIVWFDKQAADIIWIPQSWIIPLEEKSLEEVIESGEYSKDEIELLRISYSRSIA